MTTFALNNYEDAKNLALMLLVVQARLMPMFVLVPFMSRAMVPRTIAFAFAAGIGLLITPTLPGASALPNGASLLFLLVKEATLGLLLGWLAALPFWIFEAIGFMVDNQRGANMAAIINPMTGSESTPLGLMMNFAFITYFMAAGGWAIFLGLIYDSYSFWPPFEFWPRWGSDAGDTVLLQMNKMILTTLLLSSPAIFIMFLSEIGLALVSRFAPQLQVFFMAMPIKCALGLFVLIVYSESLFDFGLGPLRAMSLWVYQLDPLLRTGSGL